MLHSPVKVVLLAGGNGERFWPRSRPHLPKQFLDIDGTGSMIRRTYWRALGLVDPADILVSTQADFADLVRQHLPELPEENLILEPSRQDTAPSLGLVALLLARTDPETIIVVLPADHLITEEARFLQALRAAAGAAQDFDALVTLGIHPTRPETGYGYIQVGDVVGQRSGLPVHRVCRFVEKPDAATARTYVTNGDYLWNSGMFAWKARVLLEEIGRHLPDLAKVLGQLESLGSREAIQAALPTLYPQTPRVSIDYGVLEKSDRVLVIPGYFGWDDVGTWAALERLRPVDEHGNSVRGPVVLHECRNVLVEAGKRVVAVVGVSDLIVVDSEDALLVCHKSYAQAVKHAARKAEELLNNREGVPRQCPPN